MKILSIHTLSFVFAVFAASAQNLILTNRIELMKGVHLGLSDGPNQPFDPSSHDLRADKKTYWCLDNLTTNLVRLNYLGNRRGFDFKLLDKDGTEVPKTAMGKEWSKGPKSLTNLEANFSVTGIGHPALRLSPGEKGSSVDFAKMEDLFNFQADGEYVFEARYWFWETATNRFVRSQPVRIRVLRETAAPKEGVSNSAPHR